MSTATPETQQYRMDLSETPRVSFWNLLKVEMRKSIDTRSGFWLLLTIALVTAIVMTIIIIAVDNPTAGVFMGGAMTPQGFLLPVLGILLVTSEWSQRTAMTTFALEPSRSRVVFAKTLAAVIWAILAYAIMYGLAVFFGAISGTENALNDVTGNVIWIFLIVQVITIIQGVGYGLLFQSSPVAIVIFFAAPIVMSILFGFISGLADIAPWVDLGTAQESLFLGLDSGNGNLDLTGKKWAQLGTTSLIWIFLPFIAGWIRTMKSEVK